jgi:gluconokinase
MAEDFALGIDVGTTVVKAGLFACSTGRCVTHSSMRLRTNSPKAAWREQSPAALLNVIRDVVGDVRLHAGARWKRVCGIGIASQAGSTILVDRETGETRTPMILWNDGRASREVEQVRSMRPARFWQSRTLTPQAPAGLGRLLWLKKKNPRMFRDNMLHVGAGDFVYHALTGVWQQDEGSALQIGSFNARTGKLDGSMLALIGLPISSVAPLRKLDAAQGLIETAARKLGLEKGVPVYGPYFDQEAGYIAAAKVFKRPLQVSLGTVWVGNFVLPSHIDGESPTQIVVPNPNGYGGLVVQPLLSGGAAWDWALTTFLHVRHERAQELADKAFAEHMLPPVGLCSVPWQDQANPWTPGAHGGGAYIGVSTDTTNADLLRATAVGLVSEFARVFRDVMERRMVDGIVLCGGGAKSPYIRAMFKACTAPLPVAMLPDEEMSVAQGAVYRLTNPTRQRSQTKSERLSPDFRRNLFERIEVYSRHFQRLYGDCEAGGAFCARSTRK